MVDVTVNKFTMQKLNQNYIIIQFLRFGNRNAIKPGQLWS